jgi:hypothetical protein
MTGIIFAMQVVCRIKNSRFKSMAEAAFSVAADTMSGGPSITKILCR